MFVPEVGVVEFFLDQKKKQFGFVNVLDPAGRQTGEQIYFRYSNGRWVDIIEGEDGHLDLGFAGSRNRKGHHLAKPQAGDRIVFLRQAREEGDSAAPWGYEHQYLNQAGKLKDRLD